MRIDGTHGIDPRALGDAKALSGKGFAAPAAAGDVAKTASSAPSRGPLVQEALSASEVNLQAVEEARRMIASGELDSPEAIQRAAQAMTDRGLL